jgi:acyl-coenzyme A thioesterase 13
MASHSAEAPPYTRIKGNASDKIKEVLASPNKFESAFHKPGHIPINGFAQAINGRMEVTEVSIEQKAAEPSRVEGKAVLELDVAQGACVNEHCCLTKIHRVFVILDMANGVGSMHGGCTAFLIDM